MTRIVELLLKVGLVLGLIGAISQLVLMLIDIFIWPELRWYWGGAMAYFAAPIAFALTSFLLSNTNGRDKHDA